MTSHTEQKPQASPAALASDRTPSESPPESAGGAILLVRLTDSFEAVWNPLGLDLGVPIVDADPDLPLPRARASAVVVTAGGGEEQVAEWLSRSGIESALPVFAVGSIADHRLAARIVGAGAADYFALPADMEVLRNSLAGAVERRRREPRVPGTAPRHEAFGSIVGESDAMRRTLDRAARVIDRTAPVLIVGETGSGKELLARAVHDGGSRRDAPFVSVNCSAIPEHLFESELFGHERGAFTDAHATKPGLLEVADGGTLFLDELATLAPSAQAKLLRVLEDGVVRRVGSTRDKRVTVRLIAATNEDPEFLMAEGRLRSDLYFRLGVVTLHLPPLRERGDDAVVVARHLVTVLAHQHGLPVPSMSTALCDVIRTYTWPGNVRELRNALERCLLLSPPGVLDAAELAARPVSGDSASGGELPFPADLKTITCAAARLMLDRCDGNRSEAARRLDISRPRLRRLLKHDRESDSRGTGTSS